MSSINIHLEALFLRYFGDFHVRAECVDIKCRMESGRERNIAIIMDAFHENAT